VEVTTSKPVIGVDIGGTKCAVSLGKEIRVDGRAGLEVVSKIKFPTLSEKGPGYALGRIEQTIAQLLEQSRTRGPDEIQAIGISCGGPLDSRKGLILSPPNLPGWDAIPVVDRLTAKFGLPVALQNDANACALAEWQFGAGQGFSNLVFLTFGTGMGAGLILDNRLYSGTNDLAGEVGHVRLAERGPFGYGKFGSFEGFCSGGGLVNLARPLIEKRLQAGQSVDFCPTPGDLGKLSAEVLAQAALAGDETALEVFRLSGQYLGRGLALLIDLLNPEAIIIGSIFSRQRDLFWPHARAVIETEALSLAAQVCQVLPAGLGEQVGDFASLAVAVAYVKSQIQTSNQ
jgi:glucokinase